MIDGVCGGAQMNPKDALGRYGENLAVDFLERSGLVIIERNWRCELGELDIIARDNADLVVCEVKTRRSIRYGSPLEAVSPRKIRRMRRLAIRWLEERTIHAEIIRFDVVGILAPVGEQPTIEHVRGA
jgi:putative endonuclease